MSIKPIKQRNAEVKEEDKGEKQLQHIIWRLRVTNALFHFTRNNPRNTVDIYYRLREYCNKANDRDGYTRAIDGAQYSFDRLYGIAKAVKKANCKIDHAEQPTDKQTSTEDIKTELEEIKERIKNITVATPTELSSISEELKDVEQLLSLSKEDLIKEKLNIVNKMIQNIKKQ